VLVDVLELDHRAVRLRHRDEPGRSV